MPRRATLFDVHSHASEIVPKSDSALNQKSRIIEALGLKGKHVPSVNEETLSRYFSYLTAKLSFPFAACYAGPATTLAEVRHRCTVMELLDPANGIRDELGGISCKVHNGNSELKLPLIELEVSQENANFTFIEDYWYWFWNWRPGFQSGAGNRSRLA